MFPENLPVIIGVGDVLDRTNNLDKAKETLVLIEEALQYASGDAEVNGLLRQVDYIDVVNVASWPYKNIEQRLSEILPENPRRQIVHGELGGESPVRFINQMAQAIVKGKISVGAICGGEAQRSAIKARRIEAIPEHWTAPDKSHFGKDLFEWINPYAQHYGIRTPTDVYPLYENNLYHNYHQSFRESQKESAQLWHNLSKVSAKNPYAWIGREMSKEQLLKVDQNNRMIAFPYSKFMVANNSVNSSSALVMTSVKKAKELGVLQEKWIYVGAGAMADEPTDFLKRDNYHHSASMEVVLKQTLAFNELEVKNLDYMELYSCFPCVPKMARRILGLSVDVQLTVTGGLTFAGAALNNFMTGAATQMVRKLRKKGQNGLLYGNGEFVTKNHAVVLSKNPIKPKIVLQDYNVQELADYQRGIVPELIEIYSGEATLETYTVIYNRNGPKTAVIIGKTPGEKRALAEVPLSSKTDIEILLHPKQSLVGKSGVVHQKGDKNIWEFLK